MFCKEFLNFQNLLFYMAKNHEQHDDSFTCEIHRNQRHSATSTINYMSSTTKLQRIPQDEVKHETKTKIFTPIESKTFYMNQNHKRTYSQMNFTTSQNNCAQCSQNLETRRKITKTNNGVNVEKIQSSPNPHVKTNSLATTYSPEPSTTGRLEKKFNISPYCSESESENGTLDSVFSRQITSISSNAEKSQTLNNERHRQEVEKAKYERNIKLYQYLIDLLEENHSCVTWISRENGMFKIVDSDHFARLWGEVKLNPTMNYEKLARSFRHYYKKGIMESDSTISKTGKKKLYYKFGSSIVKSYLEKST